MSKLGLLWMTHWWWWAVAKKLSPAMDCRKESTQPVFQEDKSAITSEMSDSWDGRSAVLATQTGLPAQQPRNHRAQLMLARAICPRRCWTASRHRPAPASCATLRDPLEHNFTVASSWT
jgi:hypothetical protein